MTAATNTTLPARRVAKPEDIEKKGDWCFRTMEIAGVQKDVLIIRCPLCQADGAYPRRPLSLWESIINVFTSVSPHKGTLACPQNIKHQFSLNATTWKIKNT